MSKYLLLTIAAVILLVLGGVVEISWHGDRVSSLPTTFLQTVTNRTTWEKTYVTGVKVKRWGESLLVNTDDNRRFAIAVAYVQKDLERLAQLKQDHPDNQDLLTPQITLLEQTLQDITHATEQADLNTLADERSHTKEAFTQLRELAPQLTDHSQYPQLEETAAIAGNLLSQYIGRVAGVSEDTNE